MRSKTFQEQRGTNRGVPNFSGMKKNKQIPGSIPKPFRSKENKQLILKLFRSKEEQTKLFQYFSGLKGNKPYCS